MPEAGAWLERLLAGEAGAPGAREVAIAWLDERIDELGPIGWCVLLRLVGRDGWGSRWPRGGG
jgi:hypothetical protein